MSAVADEPAGGTVWFQLQAACNRRGGAGASRAHGDSPRSPTKTRLAWDDVVKEHRPDENEPAKNTRYCSERHSYTVH